MAKEGLARRLRPGRVRGRNALINGGFDIWQRGTSFTGNGYTADRWRLDRNSAAVTLSQQSFTLGVSDVTDPPEFFLRVDVTDTAGTPSLAQRIEDVRTFADQRVTVSFDAKADQETTIGAKLQQNFGAFGSPSAAVDRTLGEFTITPWWQRFARTIKLDTIKGKTLSTADDDYLELSISAPANTDVTLDFANFQVEQGNRPSRFDKRFVEEEVALCQRYTLVLKADNVDDFFGIGMCSNANTAWVGLPFPTRMRKAPSLSISNDTDFGLWRSSTVRDTCKTVLLNNSSVDTCRIFADTTLANLVKGEATQLVAENSSATLTFDAEL